MSSSDGGYDAGYCACPCFWGRNPASLVLQLELAIPSFSGLSVLDVGCGEGKNAAYLAQKGAIVTAIDLSPNAIRTARREWAEVSAVDWHCGDVREFDFGSSRFDVVIAYGLYHCLASDGEIVELHSRLTRAT